MSVLNINERLTKACPCGSGQTYQECCQSYHLEESYPENCEALMRSRYVAYALQLEGYLLSTWAVQTRPAELDFEMGLSWQGLTVLKTKKGRKKDKEGCVTFRAEYQVGLDRNSLTEKSRFIRDKKGHWVYLDGEFI